MLIKEEMIWLLSMRLWKWMLAFIERYKDEQALEAHNQSEHFQQFFSEVKQYLVEEPEIKVLSSN